MKLIRYKFRIFFLQKADIEITGFLSAKIAWKNRKIIVKNSHRMIDFMGNAPLEFVMSHTENNLDRFIKGLQHIYKNQGCLEILFSKHRKTL